MRWHGLTFRYVAVQVVQWMICLLTDPALRMCAANSGVQKCFSLSKGMLSSCLAAALTGFRQLVTNSLSSSPCIFALGAHCWFPSPFNPVCLLFKFSTDTWLLLLLPSSYFVSIKILQHCVSTTYPSKQIMFTTNSANGVAARTTLTLSWLLSSW